MSANNQIKKTIKEIQESHRQLDSMLHDLLRENDITAHEVIGAKNAAFRLAEQLSKLQALQGLV